MEGALPEYKVKFYDPNNISKPVTMQITKLGDLFVTSYDNSAYFGSEIGDIHTLGDGMFTSGSFKAALKPATNKVEIEGKTVGEIELNVASDMTKGELFITTVETSDKGVTVVPASEGAKVSTASGSTADIIVSGARKSVTFDDVKTASPVDIKNSGSTSTLEANGSVIASGTATEQGSETTAIPTQAKKNFSDVKENAWYSRNVKAMAEAGIINGKSEEIFAPNDNVTIAESIKLAAAVHAKLTGSTFDFSGGKPWYKPYVDYLNQTGLFPTLSGYELNSPANREEFAKILSGLLITMSETEKNHNTVTDGAIPDVPNTSENAEIYALYRAGIVAGSDSAGTYNSLSNIKRSEVAAIIHRFIDANERKDITLN